MYGGSELPVPATPISETYSPTATAFDQEIRLPAGNAIAVPDSVREWRGFGWEYIQRTTVDISQDDIERVLETGRVVSDGQRRFVVGEGTGNDELLYLLLAEGTVLAAGEIVEDPQGREVPIDRSDNHPVRDDGDHAQDYDEIKEVIQDPDQIWEDRISIHYVKKIGNKWIIVRVTKEAPGGLKISTAIEQTLAEVQEYIEDGWAGGASRVYGPPLEDL